MAQTTINERDVRFRDGLGVRVAGLDPTGDAIEQLRVSTELANQESAIRERVGRLINFRHVKYVRLRGVDRLKQGGKELVVTYDSVEGDRLSAILESAAKLPLTIDVDVALQMVRELLPGIGILHDSRKVTHGAIAPERLVYTHQHRLMIVDHGLGSGLAKLNLPRKKLWEQYRIAVPASGKGVFDERTDVVQIGLVALSALLARPLTDEDYPERLKRLILSVKESSSKHGLRPVSPELRQWLERALPVDEDHAFKTVREAQKAFEVVATNGRYAPSAAALKAFLTRYREALKAVAIDVPAERTDVDLALEEFAITIGPKAPVSRSKATTVLADVIEKAPVAARETQPIIEIAPRREATPVLVEAARTLVIDSAIEGHREPLALRTPTPITAEVAATSRPASTRRSDRLSESPLACERVGDAARRARHTSLRSYAPKPAALSPELAAPVIAGAPSSEMPAADVPQSTRGRLDALRALEEELGRLAAVDLVKPRPVSAAYMTESSHAASEPVVTAAAVEAPAAQVPTEAIAIASADEAPRAVSEHVPAMLASSAAQVTTAIPDIQIATVEVAGAPLAETPIEAVHPETRIHAERRPFFVDAIDAELARLMGDRDPEECAIPVWTIEDETEGAAIESMPAEPSAPLALDSSTFAGAEAASADVPAIDRADLIVLDAVALDAVTLDAASLELTSFDVTALETTPELLQLEPAMTASSANPADLEAPVAMVFGEIVEEQVAFEALPTMDVLAFEAPASIAADEIVEEAVAFESPAAAEAVAFDARPAVMPVEFEAVAIAPVFEAEVMWTPALFVEAASHTLAPAFELTPPSARVSLVLASFELSAPVDEALPIERSGFLDLSAFEQAATDTYDAAAAQLTARQSGRLFDVEPVSVIAPVVAAHAEVIAPFVESAFIDTSFVEASLIEASFIEASFIEAPFIEALIVEAPVLEPVTVDALVVELSPIEAPVVEPVLVEASVVEPVLVAPVLVEPVVVEAVFVEDPNLEPIVAEAALVHVSLDEGAFSATLGAFAALGEEVPAESLLVEPFVAEAASIDVTFVEAISSEAAFVDVTVVEAIAGEAVTSDASRTGASIVDSAIVEAAFVEAPDVSATRLAEVRPSDPAMEARFAEAFASIEPAVLVAAADTHEVPLATIVADVAVSSEADATVVAFDDAHVDWAMVAAEADHTTVAVVEPMVPVAAASEFVEPVAAGETPIVQAPPATDTSVPVLAVPAAGSMSRRKRSRRRKKQRREVDIVVDAMPSARPTGMPSPVEIEAVEAVVLPQAPALAPPELVTAAQADSLSAKEASESEAFFRWDPNLVAAAVPAWARGTAHGAAVEETDDALQGIGTVQFAAGAEPEAPVASVAPPAPSWQPRADVAASRSNVVPFERQVVREAFTPAGDSQPGGHAAPSAAPIRRPFLSRVHWKRTLAASLMLALLEGVAFAAAFWYVTPTELGWLIVHTRPTGIEIAVDGMSRGATPFAIGLKPGRHTIELRQGTAMRVIPVEISAGVQTEQRVTWGKAFRTGQARVTSTPEGSRVSIDGKPHGKTPLTVSELSAGRHSVTVEADSGSVTASLIVEAGETTELDVPVYSGWVSVLSPVELEIFEGGRLIGTTEAEKMMLSPGPHRLELVNESLGYKGSETVEVRPGATTSVSVLPQTTVTIEGPRGTELFVDGDRVGELPMAALKTPIGTREFVFRNPEQGERRQVVVVTMTTPLTVRY